jgi:ubiquinone/menaquinone biosynthesis C-methylase UbiE
VDNETAKDVVRRGYDALSARYDEAYGGKTKYRDWLDEILARLPRHSRVLDLGCGSGVPVALTLTESGHQVTGVDLSEVQVSRARTRVPAATFIQADATKLNLPAASFDAVLSFYALIHIPLDEQQALLHRVAEWLRPGGLFVATVGSTAWTGAEQNWLGGDVPMWWSHADASTTRIWLERAGLVVEREEFISEGAGGHTLLWSNRAGAYSEPR